jgi:hypothetical protein
MLVKLNCNTCNIKQNTSEFHTRNTLRGFTSICKSCEKLRQSAKYQSNKEYTKKRTALNQKKRTLKDPNYKLARTLRSRLSMAVKHSKAGSAVKDLNCTITELRAYLQSKFETGMTWENYGQWHVDHVKPLCSFDLSDPVQFKQAVAYQNLQPLWAKDNSAKSGKYNE